MKHLLFLFSLLFLTQSILAQKPAANEFAAIDKKALQLPDSLTLTTGDIARYITANFNSDADKSRAIFIWVASNIQYDYENMFAINFYEKKEDKISKPLLTRKGICANFASLFTDICTKAGIKSYVVEGYTKQNGFADYVPHVWSAALIDTTWFLFDPTWGSGYASNGKFYQKINNNYFKVNPETLIKSHMPFDYLWQFLYYPITNQEFYEGRTQQNNSKEYFNYVDSLKIYESQNEMDQMISAGYRIENNGVKNSLIFDRLRHVVVAIENDKRNRNASLFHNAVSIYNVGIHAFNDFINYRNKQFIPAKPDSEIQEMIDIPDAKYKESRANLDQMVDVDSTTMNSIIDMIETIDQATFQLSQQQDWLKLYFTQSKSRRRSMFYKTYWMGIPLN